MIDDAIRARHSGPHDCSGMLDGGYRVAPFAYGCDTAVVLAALDERTAISGSLTDAVIAVDKQREAAEAREARLREALTEAVNSEALPASGFASPMDVLASPEAET
jgi:hypothetical protein